MAIANFTELLVWQKAMDLVVDVYELTETYPKDQRFVLTAQTQKSASSMPSGLSSSREARLARHAGRH